MFYQPLPWVHARTNLCVHLYMHIYQLDMLGAFLDVEEIVPLSPIGHIAPPATHRPHRPATHRQQPNREAMRRWPRMPRPRGPIRLRTHMPTRLPACALTCVDACLRAYAPVCLCPCPYVPMCLLEPNSSFTSQPPFGIGRQHRPTGSRRSA